MTSLTYKVATGVTLISLSNIIIGLFNLLSFILVIRVLNRYEYGLIVLALSAVNIANTLLDPGIKNVIISDVSREKRKNRYDRVKTLLYRYFQLEIIVGLFIFIIVYLSEAYFAKRYSDVIAELIKISAFLIIANALKNIFFVTFSSHLKFKPILYLNGGESFFRFLYIFLFGYYFNFGIYGIMLTYPLSIISSIVLTSCWYINVIKDYLPITRSKEGFFFNTLTSHAKWSIGIFSLKNIINNVHPWIIQYFIGVEAVAIFNVARRVVMYLNSLLSPFESVLMPIIPQEMTDTKKINKIINKVIKYSMWISLPIIIIGILLSTKLFHILFGHNYTESAKLFRILIFVSILYSLNLTMRPIFFAFKLLKFLFVVYIISVICFIIFGVGLTLAAGLYGMVLAIIIVNFIAFLLRYLYIRSKLGLKIEFINILKIDDYDKEIIFKAIKQIIMFLRGKTHEKS